MSFVILNSGIIRSANNGDLGVKQCYIECKLWQDWSCYGQIMAKSVQVMSLMV